MGLDRAVLLLLQRGTNLYPNDLRILIGPAHRSFVNEKFGIFSKWMAVKQSSTFNYQKIVRHGFPFSFVHDFLNKKQREKLLLTHLKG